MTNLKWQRIPEDKGGSCDICYIILLYYLIEIFELSSFKFVLDWNEDCDLINIYLMLP